MHASFQTQYKSLFFIMVNIRKRGRFGNNFHTDSRDMYTDYYVQQSGTGIPIYHGAHTQRGHGLGSILSGLFRSAFPLLKRGLSFLGKKALSKGAEIVGNVAGDVAQGKPIVESAKRHLTGTINEYVPGIIPQSGSGKRRKRRRQSRKLTRRKRSRKSKGRHDILA